MTHTSLPIADLSESELRLALAEARMEITVLRAQLIQLRAERRASDPPRPRVSEITALDVHERRSSAPPAVEPKKKVYSFTS